MSLEQDLNYNVRPLFEAVDEGYTPSEWVGLTEGMTGWHSNYDGAFVLNPPIAGMFKDVTRYPGIEIQLQPVGDRFILRTVLGYAAACRYVENQALGNLGISNMINAMLVAAYKVYGPRIQNLTFQRPGNVSADYFRELEHSAGLELRLYGELTPMEFEREDLNGTINGI